jgi:hypothetical protein
MPLMPVCPRVKTPPPRAATPPCAMSALTGSNVGVNVGGSTDVMDNAWFVPASRIDDYKPNDGVSAPSRPAKAPRIVATGSSRKCGNEHQKLTCTSVWVSCFCRHSHFQQCCATEGEAALGPFLLPWCAKQVKERLELFASPSSRDIRGKPELVATVAATDCHPRCHETRHARGCASAGQKAPAGRIPHQVRLAAITRRDASPCGGGHRGRGRGLDCAADRVQDRGGRIPDKLSEAYPMANLIEHHCLR